MPPHNRLEEEEPPQGWGGGPEETDDLQPDPNLDFFVCLWRCGIATLAGREAQRQVDNKGQNDQADDADGRALGVQCDRRERSGGEGDDGDNDGSLSDRLGFYFEGEFHEWSQRRRGRW